MTWAAASTIAALRRNFASIQRANQGTSRGTNGSLHATQRTKASLTQRAFQIGLEVRLAMQRKSGFSCLDEFSRGALHEIAAPRESELAAAAGFVLAQAVRCAEKRAILWIAEDISHAESGALYGPGLGMLGLAPERVVTVSAARCRDALWAMEEALRCRAVGAVIGEIRGKNRVDLVATRRLPLAAARTGGLAFLLRSEPTVEPSAAATRWIVGATSSAQVRQALSSPRVSARLVRNRRGNLGSWVLEWNSATKRFDLAAADREPLAQAPRDRSHRAATA